MTGWKDFKKYAIKHGVHNGPHTLNELYKVYEKNKGSKYSTIVELFKTQGRLKSRLKSLKDYNKAKKWEMGYK